MDNLITSTLFFETIWYDNTPEENDKYECPLIDFSEIKTLENFKSEIKSNGDKYEGIFSDGYIFQGKLTYKSKSKNIISFEGIFRAVRILNAGF